MKVSSMARIALPFLLSCVMANAVAAQQAVPETPPELRDFRLDPERAQPAPQPEVQPPPVVPTVEPEPLPATPRSERPTAEPTRQPSRQATSTDNTAPTDENAGPAPEVAAEPSADIIAPLTQSTAPAVQPAPAPTTRSDVAWWQIAAAIAAALALLGGWLFLRKRRAGDAANTEVTIPAERLPTPTIPVGLAATPPVVTVAKRPQISLEFIPDKATLGFSALTLKGRLQLVNTGDAAASDMQLRTTMISANTRQKEVIAAFHGSDIPITPNPLGSAQAGERLALDIEMAVQVNEIDSYNVGTKKIFVPVMLVNLAYSWAGGSDNITMAWMVGRETEPSPAKMGPLRLDLGPRSFAPLGQRPLTT